LFEGNTVRLPLVEHTILKEQAVLLPCANRHAKGATTVASTSFTFPIAKALGNG
jgi:hypothetical protein